MPHPILPITRERLSLNAGWRFHLGDIPFPKLISHSDTYANAKAGRTFGAAAPEHDDTEWRELDLPHDWASESDFYPEENLSQGYRKRGFGWYRRHFRLDPADRGRHLELQFDGIATHCTVWVNGSVVHRNWCGYTSFQIDLTPFAKYGEDLNTIVVRVDADQMEGWWYEGAGIYRHTWLVKRNAIHIVTDGVYAHPVWTKDSRWHIPIQIELENSGRESQQVEVEVCLLDPDGAVVEKTSGRLEIPLLEERPINLSMNVHSPILWTIDEPTLYQVKTTVKNNGREVDSLVTTCGFRTVKFDANSGFSLNDQPLQLKGVCNHQDHAGVGVAMPDAICEWRLRRLKEMGVNAYRCAHNPPSAEFLVLCDRLGILVMDENRHFNSSPEYMRQLEWLIRRDRNHPCVFIWSVFNEEPMQGAEMGVEMVRRMVATVRKLDPSRPVTAAMNGGLFSPVNVSQAVDVVGFNYQIEFYDLFHQANPDLPLTSSEDTSAFMTRGEYKTLVDQNIRDSYDTQFAPWGESHRGAWKAIAERPYLAGGFVWTGFDYHGEPTPHQWPSTSSFFGCLDLCGFAKSAFYIHQAHWLTETPVLQIIPHWNWVGHEGEMINVMVITNGEIVRLWLNGEPLGEKAVDRWLMVSWEVAYASGRLEAVAYKSGIETVRQTVETTGSPVALQLIPDRKLMIGDGVDAQPITVQAIDSAGRPVPTANLLIEFSIEGCGQIIGLGNGDPNCHESEKGNRRSLFNGLAQVIIQTAPDSAGAIEFSASAVGLTTAKISIAVEKVPARPAVPQAQPILFLQGWRMSPMADARPDPNVEVADNDMNTWPGVQPGELQSFAGGSWAIYRLRFRPFQATEKFGGRIVFAAIVGKAEIWLDHICIGKKSFMESAALEVDIPPGSGNRQLSVLIESAKGTPAGLNDVVSIR